MKNILIIFALFFTTTVMAQSKKVQTVNIKTSAICEMCEDLIINKTLAFEKGIKGATMDVETGILTVRFRKYKTSLDYIRATISKLGYVADSVKPDMDAYNKLHFCCQKPLEEEKE